jgi:hypothetical protein
MTNAMKALGIAIPAVLVAGILAMASSDTDPDERTATIPAGTTLVAVLESQISTARSRAGDEFELRTIEPVRLRDGAEIPPGLVIHGMVTDAKRGGRLAGVPEIGLRFVELEVDGDEHAIRTDQYRFGTLVRHARSDHLVLPLGQRLRIRLSRPVTIEYHLGSPQESTAE